MISSRWKALLSPYTIERVSVLLIPQASYTRRHTPTITSKHPSPLPLNSVFLADKQNSPLLSPRRIPVSVLRRRPTRRHTSSILPRQLLHIPALSLPARRLINRPLLLRRRRRPISSITRILRLLVHRRRRRGGSVRSARGLRLDGGLDGGGLVGLLDVDLG